MIFSITTQVRSMSELMDKFYRPDRLNRPGGTRDRLIADRKQMMDNPASFCLNTGRVLLISGNDSATGRPVYAKKTGDTLQVTQE